MSAIDPLRTLCAIRNLRPMSDEAARAELIFGIALSLLLLFSAFKLGEIGGGGGSASRNKNPILFWMGVIITSVFTAIAICILAWTFFH